MNNEEDRKTNRVCEEKGEDGRGSFEPRGHRLEGDSLPMWKPGGSGGCCSTSEIGDLGVAREGCRTLLRVSEAGCGNQESRSKELPSGSFVDQSQADDGANSCSSSNCSARSDGASCLLRGEGQTSNQGHRGLSAGPDSYGGTRGLDAGRV